MKQRELSFRIWLLISVEKKKTLTVLIVTNIVDSVCIVRIFRDYIKTVDRANECIHRRKANKGHAKFFYHAHWQHPMHDHDHAILNVWAYRMAWTPPGTVIIWNVSSRTICTLFEFHHFGFSNFSLYLYVDSITKFFLFCK